MTIETLTDEERRALLSQLEWPDKEDIEKALGIIDAQTARIAELEKLQPEYNRMCLAVLAAEKMWDAANARAEAAERERFVWASQAQEQRRRADVAEKAGDAARARADAAERTSAFAGGVADRRRAERAEAEAATLRAEVERLEKLCTLRDATERENINLRSEVERLRGFVTMTSDSVGVIAGDCTALRDQLAAANALLVDAIPANEASWLIRRDEHFAACGFNPTRTEAEQAVLDAMAAVPEETLRRSAVNGTHAPQHSRAPALAELARRGLK